MAIGGTFCFCFYQAVTHPVAVLWLALTGLGTFVTCVLFVVVFFWLDKK